jgi:voltage-gated potassium channel Kch
MPKTRKIKKSELKNHIILIGSHRMGSEILSEIQKKHKLVIIDYDPEVIKKLNKQGYNCIYGDAYHNYILEKANPSKAKLAILTIPEERVILAVIAKLKKMNPKIKIFTRANFPEDAIRYYEAGADAVIIPEIIAGQKMIKKINTLVKNEETIKKLKEKHLKQLKGE